VLLRLTWLNWSRNYSSKLCRPRKKQRAYYSGKKRKHTLKAQVVVVNQSTGQIICTAFGNGRVHDFQLFKQHRIPMLPEQLCLADKGYQGLAKLHPHRCSPTQQPAKSKLDKAERQYNQMQSDAGKFENCGRTDESAIKNLADFS
jgi:hypothetical protein